MPVHSRPSQQQQQQRTKAIGSMADWAYGTLPPSGAKARAVRVVPFVLAAGIGIGFCTAAVVAQLHGERRSVSRTFLGLAVAVLVPLLLFLGAWMPLFLLGRARARAAQGTTDQEKSSQPRTTRATARLEPRSARADDGRSNGRVLATAGFTECEGECEAMGRGDLEGGGGTGPGLEGPEAAGSCNGSDSLHHAPARQAVHDDDDVNDCSLSDARLGEMWLNLNP